MRRGLSRRSTLIGATAAAWTSLGLSRAQDLRRRRLAILSSGTRAAGAPLSEAFREALRTLGYGDKELVVESRWSDGQNERLPGLAAELVRLDPDVILAGSSAAALAAKQATSSIPIVMAFTADPVGTGLVASIARPGGNVTGVSNLKEDTAGKELEFLKIAAPEVSRIAVLTNPANPSHAAEWRGALEAAQALRVELIAVEVRGGAEIDLAFVSMVGAQVDGAVVLSDPLFFAEAGHIADRAAREKLPAIYGFREHAAAGGLMSYGPDIKESFRRAATYVDKILKGANPAELPIEQPTRFELVINLRTAQALGLTIPPSLLARADEVIE